MGGRDGYSATGSHGLVNWGDTSTPTTYSLNAAGSLGSKSHTYADNGSYTVTVTVDRKSVV